MSDWAQHHILDLSTFSREDFKSVLELAHRFRSLPLTGKRKLPALQGHLVTNLFFEPSTRTRSSFEIAARNLSADVQNFTPATSSINKGESILDTALTYVAMGADVLVVRHESTGVPQQLAEELDRIGHSTAVLSAGDGLHSHPSQGLLDLYTLARHFSPSNPLPEILEGKKVLIIGDILHSRVARSNIWALTACGVDVLLCGPKSLLPDSFSEFINAPPPGQTIDPVKQRGRLKILRSLSEALPSVDAVMTLRLQKERMRDYLISNQDSYHMEYGLTHEKLKLCKKQIPILHPGPVNRGVEISSKLLSDRSRCLVEEQVKNGVFIRMAMLYLISSSSISTIN